MGHSGRAPSYRTGQQPRRQQGSCRASLSGHRSLVWIHARVDIGVSDWPGSLWCSQTKTLGSNRAFRSTALGRTTPGHQNSARILNRFCEKHIRYNQYLLRMFSIELIGIHAHDKNQVDVRVSRLQKASHQPNLLSHAREPQRLGSIVLLDVLRKSSDISNSLL